MLWHLLHGKWEMGQCGSECDEPNNLLLGFFVWMKSKLRGINKIWYLISHHSLPARGMRWWVIIELVKYNNGPLSHTQDSILFWKGNFGTENTLQYPFLTTIVYPNATLISSQHATVSDGMVERNTQQWPRRTNAWLTLFNCVGWTELSHSCADWNPYSLLVALPQTTSLS